MKIIKIFLSSSKDELLDDRNAFGNFIRRLNKIYRKRGIELELYDSNDDGNWDEEISKEELNDESIRHSNMYVAIFYRKRGEDNLHEFSVARDTFQKNRFPKVFVYFKDFNQQPVNDELKNTQKYFCEELRHYVNTYYSYDSLYLLIATQLMSVENGITHLDLSVKNGTILLDDFIIASMKKLPFAQNNQEFKRLEKRYETMIQHRDVALTTYNEQRTGESLGHYIQIENESKEAEKSFEEYQHYLLNVALRFSELTSDVYSQRYAEALALFMQGDAEKADEWLNLEEMDRLTRYELEQEELRNQNKRLQIKGWLLKVDTSMTNWGLEYEKRFHNAVHAYSQALCLARLTSDYTREEMALLLERYASFLVERQQYHLLGSLYDECVSIYRELADEDPTKYTLLLVNVLVRVAEVYWCRHDEDKGIESLLEALGLLEKVESKEDNRYRFSLMKVLSNLGSYYSIVGKCNLVEKYYTRALELARHVSLDDSSYKKEVVNVLNKIAVNYDVNHHYDQAKSFYVEALKLMSEIEGKNSHMYDADKARIYHNLGLLEQEGRNNLKAAEKYFLTALQLFRKLVGESPDAYSLSLANTLNAIGKVYLSQSAFKRADEYVGEAIEIMRRLAVLNPNVHNETLSQFLFNRGVVKINLHEVTEGKRLLREGLDLQLNAMKTPSSLSAESLIGKLDSLTEIAERIDFSCELEESYVKVIHYFELHFKEFPLFYHRYMMIFLSKLARLNQERGRFSEAEAYYLRAVTSFITKLSLQPVTEDWTENDTVLLIGYIHLAECALKLGKLEESDRYCATCMELLNQYCEEDGVELYEVCGDVLQGWGAFYKEVKRYRLAERYLKDAIAMYKKVPSMDRDTYYDTVGMIYVQLTTVSVALHNSRQAKLCVKYAKECISRLCQKDPEKYGNLIESINEMRKSI